MGYLSEMYVGDHALYRALGMLSEMTETGSVEEFHSSFLCHVGAFSGAECGTLTGAQPQRVLDAWGWDGSEQRILSDFYRNFEKYRADITPILEAIPLRGFCLTRHVFTSREMERRPFCNEFLRVVGSKDALALSMVWRGTSVGFVTGVRRSGHFEEAACRRARALAQLAAPMLVAMEAQKSARTSALGWSTLSKREREVVEYVRAGLTNDEIGRMLRISHLTARNHISNIFRKLDVSNRTELAGLIACTESAD